MALSDELARIAGAASARAAPGEEVAAILVTEYADGERTYLCAFGEGTRRTWLALRGDGEPVLSRDRVREAVSVAALCEVAADAAGDGAEPRVARLAYLDELGAKEPSIAAAIREAVAAVDELTREVESHYKLPLSDSD